MEFFYIFRIRSPFCYSWKYRVLGYDGCSRYQLEAVCFHYILHFYKRVIVCPVAINTYYDGWSIVSQKAL